MAIQIQLRQGTTTEHNTFTGAVGELTYDTQKKQLRVHDGSTVGGKVIDGTRLVTTPIDVNLENTTGVRIINGLGNTNLPFDTYGALNVYSNENFAIGALRVYQTFQPDIFNDLFFRKWDGVVWSAWERSVKFSEKNTEAFGVGQTWQDMTSSRVSGTTYTNSTSRAIELYIHTGVNGSSVTVGGSVLPTHGSSMIQLVVPSGKTYSYGGSFSAWWELR